MEETSKKHRLWPKVLLAVSLALNLLVVGIVAGAAYRHHRADSDKPHSRGFGPVVYRALPEAQREALRAQTRSAFEKQRSTRKADLEAVIRVLAQTPFDGEALAASVRTQSRNRDALSKTVQDAWLAQVASLSDAERAAYAERLVKMSKRKPRRRP
ncbi:MAG: periplasmic heavy metal sensor [Pseudomonadota bacterium]